MSSFEDFSLGAGTSNSGAWNLSTAKMFSDAYGGSDSLKIPTPVVETTRAQQTTANGGHHNWWDGTKMIARDIGTGALDELEHRPLQLLLDLGIGAAAAAAAIAIGPDALSGAGIAGAIGATTSLIGMRKDVTSWLHDAKVILNQDSYSQAEVDKANKGIGSLGGGVMEATAGFAGGALASGVMAHLPQLGFKDGNGALSTRLGDSMASETSLLTRKYEVTPHFQMPTSTVFGASRHVWLGSAERSKSALLHI